MDAKRQHYRRIYLASSWRNERQPEFVALLRKAGHEVYDFRNPPGRASGFSWRSVDADWRDWTPAQFRDNLNHPAALEGFEADWQGMLWADTFVLLMPCGRSAHLEAGWALGAGKPTAIVLADGEPELMYRMASTLCVERDELLDWLQTLSLSPRSVQHATSKIARSYAARLLCGFAAALCADPDGLPTNRAHLQHAAEIFVNCLGENFEERYDHALREGSFSETELERAQLRTRDERNAAMEP